MTDVLAVVSDLHAGHPAGLLSPRGVVNAHGNVTAPNDVQRWAWERWEKYWDDVSEARKKVSGRLVVAVLGEFVDGFHHRSTEILTPSEGAMIQAGIDVMGPAVALKPDALVVVKGTEAHSGNEGGRDNAIAAKLGAVEDPATQQNSFYQRTISVNGTRFHLAHHVGGARLPWTKGGNANRLAAELVHSHFGDPAPPHVAFRGHIHPNSRIDSGRLHPIRVIVSYCWQLSSTFGHKIDTGGGLRPVGGDIVYCDGDHYEIDYREWKLARDPVLAL